jgi:DNA-binding MurR/RpiR family transcriptional regulator
MDRVKAMGNRQQIQEIPGALRMTLEKAHADYGERIRRVRWGEGPIYVCGAGDCGALGLAAGYAFETFPGWPVVARPVEVFQNYDLALLHPRSVLVMMSARGDWPEAQELAHSAQQRGCTLVALTSNPEGPLANLADHVFPVQAEGNAESAIVTVCMHGALNFLAFEAMRLLKRPKPYWDAIAKEFDQLPNQLEWVYTQLSFVLRSAAAEVALVPGLSIVGGGFFHYPACRVARRVRLLSGLRAEALEASEYRGGIFNRIGRDDSVIFLSGSHSKLKKLIHGCAAQTRSNGARVLSLTDSNDRELVDTSDLGILVPSLQEAPASILTLFILEWLATEVSQAAKHAS